MSLEIKPNGSLQSLTIFVLYRPTKWKKLIWKFNLMIDSKCPVASEGIRTSDIKQLDVKIYSHL